MAEMGRALLNPFCPISVPAGTPRAGCPSVQVALEDLYGGDSTYSG